MRVLAAIVMAALPLSSAAQETKKADPSRTQLEVIGCAKGSTLVENPSRRWRLRGPKQVINRIKENASRELKVIGTTRTPHSGTVIGSTRLGKANIYIGGNASKTAREPLPELPTIDVESFELTGESCPSHN